MTQQSDMPDVVFVGQREQEPGLLYICSPEQYRVPWCKTPYYSARIVEQMAVALESYLIAQPQCECSDNSGCPMATARVNARNALIAWLGSCAVEQVADAVKSVHEVL